MTTYVRGYGGLTLMGTRFSELRTLYNAIQAQFDPGAPTLDLEREIGVSVRVFLA
jgi:hypothetical protein